MFYVYLIESEKDGRYYIGQISNIENRIKNQNSNRSNFVCTDSTGCKS